MRKSASNEKSSAVVSKPVLAVTIPSLLTAGRFAYFLLKERNAKAANPLMRSKLLEANMKNRFERAGVTDAFANLVSELKNDIRDAAKSKGSDARESLASVLDDVAEKVRTNTQRASSRLRHSNDGGSNIGKVALVLGIAGLVGVLFAAGAAHDDAPQSNS